jgi:hypothetical protein
LACVRFSLRADKSSLHPLLLTMVRSCISLWRSIRSYFDRQLPRTEIGKYKHCCNVVFAFRKAQFLSP